MGVFQTVQPKVENNVRLRIPQIEGFAALREQASSNSDREVGVILPVGCGKSGLIAITPFAYASRRTLVVAPGLKIAEQLYNEVDPAHPENFYRKCLVIDGSTFPEPAEIRGTTTNRSDLDEAEIVITNIQQLQGEANRWLTGLPSDFFDLILFDEGHHSVASSWELLRQRFPQAKIVNYSATPQRADGQIMSGRVVYSFPVFRAIREGYVKRLKAICLNPRTLKYVRREDNQEIEVGLDEVRRLGEQDSDFRRSIVTSEATLYTIVDASINELRRLQQVTGEKRLKIIATALNLEHCVQVTGAYRARGLRADYIHSNLDGAENQRILRKLENHELDVIIQVRKLGEGFNHLFLSVAAVFNVFSSLSPFVQFVGRIMRVIEQNSPQSPLNQGTVVYHAGSNIASRWDDFQAFSDADQEYFDQLLPEEGLEFNDGTELVVEPRDPANGIRDPNPVRIRSQDNVSLEERHLLDEDEEARKAFEVLAARGFTPDQYRQAFEHQPVPTSKVRERQAMRAALDERIQIATGRILRERGANHQGYSLDKRRLGRTNFQILKSAIDTAVSRYVGRGNGERSEFSREDLDRINGNFEAILGEVVAEVFNGEA